MYRIIAVLFLTTQLSFGEMPKAKWVLEDYHNEDGSFGEIEKEIITSLVMLTFLNHGETPRSKYFGNYVDSGLKYLSKKADNLDDTVITLRTAYIFWALSEAYSMTSDKEIGRSVNKMALIIISGIRDQKISEDDILIYNILSNALYSAQQGGLIKVHKDLKPMMEKIILHAWSLRPLSIQNCARLLQMSQLWDVDIKNIKYTMEDLDYRDKAKINELVKKLNTDSKTRKEARKEISTLSLKLYLALISQLYKSDIVELKETAKELKPRKEVIFDPEKSIKLLKNNPCGLFSATHSYFIMGGENWRWWNKTFQKLLADSQSKNGTWDKESFTSPEFLNLNKTDKILFNSCYAILSVTAYYRYLNLFKKKVKKP